MTEKAESVCGKYRDRPLKKIVELCTPEGHGTVLRCRDDSGEADKS